MPRTLCGILSELLGPKCSGCPAGDAEALCTLEFQPLVQGVGMLHWCRSGLALVQLTPESICPSGRDPSADQASGREHLQL